MFDTDYQLESLIFESYTNFILAVGCITVIVIWSSKYLIPMLEICMVEGSLKVHVLFSKYCLLIVSALFPESFQRVKVRGIQIKNIQNRMVSQNSLNETMNFNLSCDVALYSLCYPVIKSCNYWNYNSSLPTIVDKGKKTYRKSSLAHNQQSPVNLPRTVDVYETKVNWDNLFKSEGLLTDSLQSKSIRENEIIHNSECTGFLI